MTRILVRVSICVSLFVGQASPALAEPLWQFPWPNGKNPLADAEWRVSGNTYGCNTHDAAGPGTLNTPWQWDERAIDFARAPGLGLTLGSPVAAGADGIVVKRVGASQGFGRYVILDHSNYYTMYAHLDSWESWLDVGDRVRAGRTIAAAGFSGLSSPSDAHLHFQTGRGQSGSIDPHAPEFITGINTNNSNYKGWDNFGQWGYGDDPGVPGVDCNPFEESPYWWSGPHLSDAFIYRYDAFGSTRTRYADGTGGWKLNDFKDGRDNSEAHIGFFAEVGSTDGDEVSDVLFYRPDNDNNQWEVWIRKPQNDSWKVIDDDDYPSIDFINKAQVHPAELNGDGLTDLILYRPIFGATEAKFQTWLADGQGTWEEGHTNTWSQEGFDLVTGFFDDDHLTDILTYDPEGDEWRVRRADGDGTWTLLANGPAFGSSGRDIAVGYFDNDRRSDIYRWRADVTQWAVLSADGDGTWTQMGSGSWGDAMGQIEVGYFDDDKTQDVFRYDNSDGSWETAIADGSGGWDVTTGPALEPLRILYQAQIDQDERTDIVLYRYPTGDVTTHFSQGSGAWSADVCGGGCNWPILANEIDFGYFDRDIHT